MKKYYLIDDSQYNDVEAFDSLEEVQQHVDDMDAERLDEIIVVHGTKMKIKKRIELVNDED